nr:RNA polymerase beta subunit protein a [Trochiscia hystrix]
MLSSHYLISDFLEIQRKSFFRLLQKGIKEEFSKRNPINNRKKELEIFFYPEFYKLSFPKLSLRDAIIYSKSYSSRFYIPVQLTNKKTKTIKFKWVLLGHLPLMTKRGHFLINGAARIIINQIIRSPGIYYHGRVYEIFSDKWNNKPDQSYYRYYADLICMRGTWLRIEIDKEKIIWARMKKSPKMPLWWILIAMGLSERVILKSVFDSKRLLEIFDLSKTDKYQEYPYVKNPMQAWKQIALTIYSKKNPDLKITSELGRQWIFRKFMNPRTYDLGHQGRICFNKKLGLSISLKQFTLTPKDLLAATDYLFKLEKGLKDVDDIDHLKNRRVRTSGELIQIQFGIGLLRLEKLIREKLNKRTKKLSRTKKGISFFSIPKLINTKPLNGALKEFFGTSPLSQFMDQINPLAEITHKRRLSSLGPGGVTRDTATLAIRGIHPTHYGRICPIETPEGKNTGLVNSITTYARVNNEGLIETPFYKMYLGQVQKEAGLFFLTADKEENVKVAAADLSLSAQRLLPKQKIPFRIGSNFKKIFREQVEYIGISSTQMISIATSLIPFLEHDDANRALMGSNMQRQAVPLLRPERPLVGTGLEARTVSDSGHSTLAKNSGFIIYVSAEKILIRTLK